MQGEEAQRAIDGHYSGGRQRTPLSGHSCPVSPRCNMSYLKRINKKGRVRTQLTHKRDSTSVKHGVTGEIRV